MMQNAKWKECSLKMNDVIVHRYEEPNLKKLKKNKNADCCNCMMAEKTKLIDGEDGYLCHASLYDTKTLACFVPRAEQIIQ